MKENKFTKGKWTPVYDKYKQVPKTICIGVGVPEKIDGGTYTRMICNTILPDTDEEYINERDQIEADAKLISAAPDMLSALNNCADELLARGLKDTWAYEIAVRAIKKATA